MAGTRGAKPRFANTRLGWFAVAVLWLFMGALIVWGKGGLLDYLQARAQIRALQAEVQSLEEGNAALKADIQRLRTHPEAYEAEARERLLMKRPGEVILYLPEGRLPREPVRGTSGVSGEGPSEGDARQTPPPNPPVPPKRP